MKQIMREGPSGAVAGGVPTASSNESQSQHTPGPWSVEEQWATDADGKGFRFAYWIGADDGEICRSVLSLEDARLIAAAPDLLAALKDVFAVLGEGEIEYKAPFLHRRMKAAIKKAEG